MARQTYVQGSAVRKINNEAERQTPVRVTPKRPKFEVVESTPIKKGKYSFGNVFAIFTCVVIIGAFVTGYIKLSSDVYTYRKQCTTLESQYEKLKLSNDLYEDRIVNSVDLAEIERVAACELGMKLAGKGQIVVYSGEIEDYVKQYVDLPQ